MLPCRRDDHDNGLDQVRLTWDRCSLVVNRQPATAAPHASRPECDPVLTRVLTPIRRRRTDWSIALSLAHPGEVEVGDHSADMQRYH